MSPVILALLSPAIIAPVVTALLSLIKRAPVVKDVKNEDTRNLMFRGGAAVLSLGGVLGAFMLTGVAPDPKVLSDILVVIAMVFISVIGSIGTHSLTKK